MSESKDKYLLTDTLVQQALGEIEWGNQGSNWTWLLLALQGLDAIYGMRKIDGNIKHLNLYYQVKEDSRIVSCAAQIYKVAGSDSNDKAVRFETGDANGNSLQGEVEYLHDHAVAGAMARQLKEMINQVDGEIEFLTRGLS